MSLGFSSRYNLPFIGIPNAFVQLLGNPFDFLYKEEMPMNCAFTN